MPFCSKKKPSSASVLMNVVRNEGFTTLYNGLSAGYKRIHTFQKGLTVQNVSFIPPISLLRQATYTTTRLGIYTWLFETFTDPQGKPPSFFMKAALGMTAGATGAFVGTPAEVALIRMTSDGSRPVDQRRNYKNVFDALVSIKRSDSNIRGV